MYLLINPDKSINFADEHPIKKNLHFEGLKLVEFSQKRLKEVMGDIALIQARWDERTQKIIQDPLCVPESNSEPQS